eukprot:364824-Chlamydomonas_euryale.AAC.4
MSPHPANLHTLPPTAAADPDGSASRGTNTLSNTAATRCASAGLVFTERLERAGGASHWTAPPPAACVHLILRRGTQLMTCVSISECQQIFCPLEPYYCIHV